MKHVLITGVNGFVGRALAAKMIGEGWQVRGTIRESENTRSSMIRIETVVISPIGPRTCWKEALEGIDTVIHLAARVHVMHETAANPLKEFRITNSEGTAKLAQQAAGSGVKRFVFMSTIGVNGTCSGQTPYTENSIPAPHNPYSISKWEAEKHLTAISANAEMEIVVIRAPLVYGPGTPGNFLSLMHIVLKSFPLPFKSIDNRRSFLFVGNLVDALITCSTLPAAAGKTYLVSDGEDLSTPELISRVASAMGRPARLFPFPPAMLDFAGRLLGKSSAVERLIGSLQVDSSKIVRELGWKPPFTMEQGLADTVAWFMTLRACVQK
jgi:nucleoside-diphosphate-sugar epimerase